ncbi:hypothetical protein B0H19DRAFT_1226823 [Mycena capillaripes]|nr:hypothetical protein B0H19DRAFT_1226823 [Mycena capillaripes]
MPGISTGESTIMPVTFSDSLGPWTTWIRSSQLGVGKRGVQAKYIVKGQWSPNGTNGTRTDPTEKNASIPAIRLERYQVEWKYHLGGNSKIGETHAHPARHPSGSQIKKNPKRIKKARAFINVSGVTTPNSSSVICVVGAASSSRSDRIYNRGQDSGVPIIVDVCLGTSSAALPGAEPAEQQGVASHAATSLSKATASQMIRITGNWSSSTGS